MSSDNLRAWASEGVVDTYQILEAVLTLEEDGSTEARRGIEREILRQKTRAVEAGLDVDRRPMRTSDVAKAVGLKKEYDAFFSFYSKLVHPTSLSVNYPEIAGNAGYRDTLLVRIQLYGISLLSLSQEWCGPHPPPSLRRLVSASEPL